MSSSTCDYCNAANASFRCVQCKQVKYCSRECQQSGWKEHKKACRAWGELSQHVQTLPLDEAQRRFQQAQDTIGQLEKLVQKEGKEGEKEAADYKRELNSINVSPISVRDSSTTLPAKEQSQPILQAKESPSPSVSKVSLETTIDPKWRCTMEELVHLDSYQVTLRPLSPSDAIPDAIPEVQLESISNNNATLVSIGSIVSWKIPAVVSDYRASRLDGCLSVRLQCEPDAFLVPFYTTATTAKIEQLACKACDSQLLSNSIDRVVPLPSGYWDEITDYIQCYPGEAAVDFGTTTVPPSCAWEDAHVFVLHPGDVKDVAITTLASVDPYGTSMNELSWQPEGRQVETLCCSYCCAAWGVVTTQGYHLYKHRLLLQQPNGATAAAADVPIFIANELKRYAESQAIFTFVVVKNSASSSSSSRSSTNKASSSCLLLHVLSWDSTMMSMVGGDSSTVSQQKKRVVKLIYEESSQLPSFHRDEEKDDITSWTWGGLDLCCDPGVAATTTKAKSVVLTLEDEEWTELADSIGSCRYYFPQQVVDATVLVKLGKKRSNRSNHGEQIAPGMAALDLS